MTNAVAQPPSLQDATGIFDFRLPKPFNLSSLFELVETALRLNH